MFVRSNVWMRHFESALATQISVAPIKFRLRSDISPILTQRDKRIIYAANPFNSNLCCSMFTTLWVTSSALIWKEGKKRISTTTHDIRLLSVSSIICITQHNCAGTFKKRRFEWLAFKRLCGCLIFSQLSAKSPQFNLAMQQVTPFKMITTRDDRSLKHVRVILA